MAKRDVNVYFLTVQDEYLEMVDNLKEFKELAEEGKITQEEYDEQLKNVDILKANYERLAYIMFLLNKPKRSKLSKNDLEWYSYLKGSSKEAIIDENRDVLADFKKLFKKYKDGE